MELNTLKPFPPQTLFLPKDYSSDDGQKLTKN